MPLPGPNWDRLPVIISFSEPSVLRETYGFTGSQGQIVLEGQRLVPRNSQSETVYLFMHPASTLHMLPMPAALAAVGLHVLCAGSRYAKNDSALILEKVVYDLGRYVQYAREELGYRYVVLVGWSGGGSLSLLYQAEAESPTIRQTPAGDAYDLTNASLQPADGIIFIAAHLSRAETLTEFIDPSVCNETDPDARDIDLDIYNDACPVKPPFNSAFIELFRRSQVARNRKITQWALELLESLKRKNDGEIERGFVVHRTMCDVRWIDPAVDPNDRKPGWSYLGDPRVANSAPAGLARFSTLRSWLSQWSYDLSNGNGLRAASRVRGSPVLQVVNSADDAVPTSHGTLIRTSLATADKEYVEIKGATHYYAGQPAQLAECVRAVTQWSGRKGFLM